MTAAPILTVEHIGKALGGDARKAPTQIIGDLSFDAAPGEFISVVGAGRPRRLPATPG